MQITILKSNCPGPARLTSKTAWKYNASKIFAFDLGGLIVDGSINTKQYCPVCSKKFTSEFIDSQGFHCPNHFTRPTRYFLSLRAFKAGDIYKDPKTDKVLETYSQALDVLIAINRDKKEKGKRFNPDDWKPSKVVEKRIENIIPVWLRNHAEESTKGVKTQSWYRQKEYICNSFIVPFFKSKDVGLIDREDIEKFYHHLLDKKHSTKYIKQILNILKSLFLRYRPAAVPQFPDFVIVPKREKQRLGLAREIEVLEKVPERHGYRLAILTLLRTGMRINEVVAMKVHNLIDGIAWVDKAISSDGTLRLARKSGGTVPYRLTPELWTLLMEHIESKDMDAYMFEINGEPLKTDRLYKVWTKACNDAKVKHINLQQASRHSMASSIKEQFDRQALEEIRKQLEHRNLTTGKKHYIV